MQLVELNADVLLHIFSYLDPVDLHSILCLDVPELNPVIDVCLRRVSKTMLITGSDCFANPDVIKCNEERLRIHTNWCHGESTVTQLFSDDNLKYIGRMQMNDKHFYLSNKGELRKYERHSNGLPSGQWISFNDIEEDPVISTMLLKEDHLFTGSYYGTCSHFYNGQKLLDNFRVHDSYKDILAMDFSTNNHILATSNFREIKLFRLTENGALNVLGEADWRARCMKMNVSSDGLVVGNVCTDFHTADGFITRLNPLSLFNLETMTKRDLNCTSAGVVALEWTSAAPNVILTGHWTGDLRVFDLRSDADVMTMRKVGAEDVNVSLNYDGQFGVVCGFRNTSEVCLYDLRWGKGRVQSLGVLKHPELSTYLLDVLVEPRQLFVNNFNEVQAWDFSH